jgi:hypothetical protein
MDPLLRTLIQLSSPRAFVGRIMGVLQFHRSVGELVPLALSPMLAATFGVQKVLIGGGLLVAAGAFASIPYARSMDARTGGHTAERPGLEPDES